MSYLFNTMPFGMILKSVGIVKSNIKEPFSFIGESEIVSEKIKAIKERMNKIRHESSQIVINKDMIDLIDGIDQYSHLIVLYWGHKVTEQSKAVKKVHPMGIKEIPKVGIFCTCSPMRPNPVLMTVVRLVRKKENVLEVLGLDAVDQSPIIDIKPYIKGLYPVDKAYMPNWFQDVQDEIEDIKL